MTCVTHHHACECREAEFERLRTRLEEVERRLPQIISMAGNPDPAEGCRLIIERARELLNKSSAKKE